MKANEFVKKFGIERVKKDLEIVNKCLYNSLFTESFTKELKRLVESHELVQLIGGIAQAKHELITLQKHEHITFGWVRVITLEKIDAIKQAVKDVESCQ